MKTEPLKRSKALQSLSREHHYGLLLCWKIRSGIKKSVDIERIKAYTDWFFKNSLSKHFSIEEEFVFKLLGNNHEYVKKALADHRRLIRLFEDAKNIEKSLNQLEEELEKHIRFEERVLFPEIQKTSSEHEIELIMKIHSEESVYEDWGDEFWK
ncbi:MAG: cation-binding protein [Sphingobacteriaceae bacterium]|nr:cation-binding protein [Sphingobacteriaceae bacterium]